MIRKLFAFVLSMILLFSAALAQDHDDIDITELLESVSESSTEKLSLDDDGAILMTITCTGDFTIGGDTYHKNDIFSKELEEHGGDIDFVMENVRDILSQSQKGDLLDALMTYGETGDLYTGDDPLVKMAFNVRSEATVMLRLFLVSPSFHWANTQPSSALAMRMNCVPSWNVYSDSVASTSCSSPKALYLPK